MIRKTEIVKIKKFHPDAQIPKMGTNLAGAYDVTATEMIYTDDLVIYKLGFGIELPTNYRLMIIPRSNISGKGWVLGNSEGLIDCDYRGEIQVRFVPDGQKTNVPPYSPGDRIAQCYLEEVINIEFQEVNELSSTERNVGGFGSTRVSSKL